MSDKCAIFIDGGYLDKVFQDEFGSPRVDYLKLSKWLSRGTSIFRTYYYNCLPYQSNPPTTEESQRFSKKQAFYGRLKQLERYEVRLGKLEFRGNRQDGTPIFVQKRVDILLGVDLALLAAKNRITHATIFAGDSDFLPAISVAKNEGVLITLAHGGASNPPHDDLWREADERIQLDTTVVNSILRQNPRIFNKKVC
ncbi:NYN domain-containing protein [Heliomicrobium modesticaldum]|uniref:NYN domain-containing protein n=1 Tax=Heliomicrobium modesticaldum TaxID=35701 RepID=UPI00164FD709|nr:NYN domain-containing protein [Heliomicrobium modesticaldum]